MLENKSMKTKETEKKNWPAVACEGAGLMCFSRLSLYVKCESLEPGGSEERKKRVH